ncbi:MAG: hypothetical protein K2M36_03150, partial [Clostridia bacterium]|nr:hypothetical protein [Clostridia bacterium]
MDSAGRYHEEYENCYGGSATCAKKAVCEVCHVGYGEKSKEHTGKIRIEEEKYLVDNAYDCMTRPTYYYTCLCGEIVSKDTYEGNLILRHTVVEDEYVPAYFGESGLTRGYHCELCNFVFTEQEEIEPLREKYNNYEVYFGKDNGIKYDYLYKQLTLSEDGACTLSETKYRYKGNNDSETIITDYTGSIVYCGNHNLNSYRLDIDEFDKPMYITFDGAWFYIINEDGSAWVKDVFDRPIGATQTTIVPRRGNSVYGYNDLANNANGASMQSLYRRLYAICEQFIDNDEDIVAVNDNYLLESINLSDLGVSIYEAVAVWKVFYLENPRYYWLSNTVSSYGENMLFCIDGEFASASYRRECDLAIDDMVHASSILLNEEMSEVEVAVTLHDFLVKYMNYAYEEDGVTPEDEIWAHNMVGAAKHRLGVCEAYTKSYLYLCLLNNIDCLAVSGELVEDGGHAWNLVCIDGEWYGVDCTWDDNGDDENISLSYFGMSHSVTDAYRIADLPVGEGIDYLYELPLRSNRSLKPVELYENDEFVGLYGSLDMAFGAMTN